MDTLVWVLGPIVVAFFGFLFWLIVGKMSSNRPENESSNDSEDSSLKSADE